MRIDPAEWMPRGIDDLEPAAWDALRAGTSSVAAGPGAGKSEFLAQRASYLLETHTCRPPRQILAIAFKRDAAANLGRRVQDRLPGHAKRFSSMTFDAFTKSIVDRFKDLLPAPWKLDSGYKIGFANRREVRNFLTDIGGAAPEPIRNEVFGLPDDSFINNILGSRPLAASPPDPELATSATEYAVQQWWALTYLGREVPTVDFVALNRLAELIIRSAPQLQRALTATYPFVFVDEFQDVTYAQYSFLESVFGHGAATVTVVGDRNQRIMGWAGALTDAFAQFEHDFNAEPFVLTSNFRSNQQLVDLQHRFAMRLDPASQKQKSQVSQVGESPIEIWSFSTAALEAESIAAWIAADLDGSGRHPADYALIARQRVAELEPILGDALATQGLRVRNDDSEVGQMRLQDLLKDELARLLLGLIRLGTARGGQPETWRDVTHTLSRLAPDERGREVGSQREDDLSAFISELRSWFAQTDLNEVIPGVASTVEMHANLADRLTSKLTDFIRLEEVAYKRVFGDRPEDLQVSIAAFAIRLAHVLGRVDSWSDVGDAFTDEGAVPLLTIHRSKGLEYHTVFFVGLDNDQWWAHAKNVVESTMTFFVGVSRAAERLIFTQCDERGDPGPLADIYGTLEEAGISVTRIA